MSSGGGGGGALERRVGVGVVVLPDRRHDLFRVFSLLHSLLLVRVKIARRLSLIRPKGRKKHKKQKISEQR